MLHKFAQIIDQTASTVEITDTRGVIEYVNPRFTATSGYSAEEVIGQRSNLLKSGHTTTEEYRQMWETLQAGEVWKGEFHNRRKDGSLYWESAIISPIRDEAGCITHFAAIKDDITERKRMEQELATREQEFRSLAESLPDNIVRYNREGVTVYVNPVLERTLGDSATAIIGTTPREYHPDGSYEDYAQLLDAVLASGEAGELEKVLPGPDGEACVHLIRMVPEFDGDGEVVGVLVIGNDITERKRNESELERHRHHLEKLVEDRTHALAIAKETAETATRAKTHFLAAASHDLRQPLLAIELFNDSLAGTELDERQRKISRYLTQSVNSLTELLDQLLDISRIEAGVIEPQPEAIQADDLLGMIDAEFDAACQEKNLRLNLRCSRPGLALFSDRSLLKTLLRNLVGNAVKYTTHGNILVGIRRRNEHALIQVWDTGIGIPPEQIDSIFDEYFQVGNVERDRSKGVGLGLSIVRRLSKLLDIGVRVRSAVGKGSVFELSVPLANESDVHAAATPSSARLETIVPPRFSGKRIVVIEDDGMVAEAIKLSLEREGMHVTLFATAEDALESTAAINADYYVSDYRLPGMDGLQLLDAMQRNSAEPIKAVLLTGNTSPDQVALMQSSRWKVLFKPIGLPGLLSALAAHDAMH